MTVTSDQQLADLLVQDGPVLLVSTSEQAQGLVTEWGLKPATMSAETSVQHEPSGPAVPLADAFPGLPRAVLAKHGDVDLVPCGALWSEIRTARGVVRTDLESHHAAQERGFLYREAPDDDTGGHQVLSALVSALALEMPNSAVTDAVQYNMEAAESERIAAIRAVSTVSGKLAEMFGEARLRRHLPRALIDSEAGFRAFSADELARMILAVRGSAALRMMCSDGRTRTGPTPPRRWAGERDGTAIRSGPRLPGRVRRIPCRRAASVYRGRRSGSPRSVARFSGRDCRQYRRVPQRISAGPRSDLAADRGREDTRRDRDPDQVVRGRGTRRMCLVAR